MPDASVDARSRLTFMAQTVDELWPGGFDTPMVVLPGAGTPRLLTPIRPRRAGMAAVVRYTAQQGVRDRAKGLALATAIGVGLATHRDVVGTSPAQQPTIDDRLGEVLGEPVISALALTADRPNRKPVLQVFDARGRTIAFAKVGLNDLAQELVAAESATLAQLAAAGLAHCDVPRVLHAGEWRGHAMLVASALPVGRALRDSDVALDDAMIEVAQTASGDVAGYLDTLRDRAARTGARADEWCAVLDLVIDSDDLAGLPFGAWHGDWTSWNCARRRGRIGVWDWERFATPAPLGFDRLHFVLNDAVGHTRERFAAEALTLINRAPELLRRWPLRRRQATTISLLYVLDIALRYLTDGVHAANLGGRPDDWALPVVRAALTASRPRTNRE